MLLAVIVVQAKLRFAVILINHRIDSRLSTNFSPVDGHLTGAQFFIRIEKGTIIPTDYIVK